MAGGHYHHFGIKTGVVSKLEGYRSEVENMTYISLQINIDGLPIFKSSAGQFWPILGMVDNLSQKDPFEIGVYYGTSKPTCNVAYLSLFKDELNQLSETGINCFGINFSVRLSALICDAPARSFVKGTKGHNGYNSCERCTTSGTWCGRMTFPILDAPLRDDASFDARDDEAHHTGSSPLSGCLGMVSQIPLDYMHLVCLGVKRRLLLLWLKGQKSSALVEHNLVKFLVSSNLSAVILLSILVSFYGKEFLVYNVHCLIHLPQDARVFGSLDNISCFPFENFLGKIKKLVRKPSQPLQQVVHRLTEKKSKTLVQVTDEGPRCRKLHIFGPIPNAILQGYQYKEYISLVESYQQPKEIIAW
ncbi:uncharacterized protein LOC119586651 [Penaeus monodon]|uniref:uncharacterized protein LOC119586651 n=1 Tax=Penaeus monodon TaxID=6687 RepID=UPI0018A79755|nr:uncharacterized protein LOC119586651 [Penaeus monodon]